MITESAAFEEFSKELPDRLAGMAQGHLGERLGLLEWDPIKYPYQDPDCVVWESKIVVDERERRLPIASMFIKNYPEMLGRFVEDERSKEEIFKVRRALDAGQNVIVVTPHTEDIGDIGGAMLVGRDAIEDTYPVIDNTVLLASKGTTRMTIKIQHESEGVIHEVELPLLNPISLLSRYAILTYPRTESAKQHTRHLSDEVIDHLNGIGTRRVNQMLDLGAAFVGIAVTGTLQIKRDEQGNIELPGLSRGTKKILTRPDTYLWPMIVETRSDNPYAYIAGELANPRDEDEIKEFMSNLEQAVNLHDTRN